MIDLSTLKKGLHIWTNQAEELVIAEVSPEVIVFEGRNSVLHPSQVCRYCFTSEIDAVSVALYEARLRLEVQRGKVAELSDRYMVLYHHTSISHSHCAVSG